MTTAVDPASAADPASPRPGARGAKPPTDPADAPPDKTPRGAWEHRVVGERMPGRAQLVYAATDRLAALRTVGQLNRQVRKLWTEAFQRRAAGYPFHAQRRWVGRWEKIEK